MRSMWKGTVAFGLVSIPIHLYAATESKSISFRQVHAADGGRVQLKRVCSEDGREVPYAEIAKGYELDDGSMVILTDKDLAEVPVPSSQTIEVLEFLPLDAIDPIAYDRSYYLEPQKTAVKPYVLLRDALAKSGRVALVKITLRQRESMALLRVSADVIVLSTLLWPQEVRTPDFAFLADPPQIRDQELAMAGSLIESMAEDVFDPDGYQDSYQQALTEVINAKIEGKDAVAAVGSKETKAEVVDLMSALEASLGDRDTGKSATKPKSRSTGKSAPKSEPATAAGKAARGTKAGANGKTAAKGAGKTSSTGKTGKAAGNGKPPTRRSKGA